MKLILVSVLTSPYGRFLAIGEPICLHPFTNGSAQCLWGISHLLYGETQWKTVDPPTGAWCSWVERRVLRIRPDAEPRVLVPQTPLRPSSLYLSDVHFASVQHQGHVILRGKFFFLFFFFFFGFKIKIFVIFVNRKLQPRLIFRRRNWIERSSRWLMASRHSESFQSISRVPNSSPLPFF